MLSERRVEDENRLQAGGRKTVIMSRRMKIRIKKSRESKHASCREISIDRAERKSTGTIEGNP